MLSIVLSGTFATRPLTVMEERRVDGLSWRHLPIKLKMDQALNVFTEYIMPVVKPSWSKDKVRLLNCNDGLGTINELIGFYQEGSDNTEGSNVVLLRVNGEMTHYMSDRQKEIATMLVLQQLGGNPPLYCEFTNGICYGFAAGNPLSSQDFDNADVIRSVMKSVARLHTIKLPAEYRETSSVIFKYYDKWSELIPLEFKDKVVTDKFNETFGSLCELKKEVDEMKSLLLTFKSPLVFCHNDLQFGNLIYDERTQHTTIIDHEFGGLNYVACELGDIFSEQAGLDCDYSKYPNEEKQKLFIRIYLEESAKLKGNTSFFCLFKKLQFPKVSPLSYQITIFTNCFVSQTKVA